MKKVNGHSSEAKPLNQSSNFCLFPRTSEQDAVRGSSNSSPVSVATGLISQDLLNTLRVSWALQFAFLKRLTWEYLSL